MNQYILGRRDWAFMTHGLWLTVLPPFHKNGLQKSNRDSEGTEGLFPGHICDGLNYASKKEKGTFSGGHGGHKCSHYWLCCALVAVTKPSADGKFQWSDFFHFEF